MARYEVVEATPYHADHIAEHMRSIDQQEIWLASKSTPSRAMHRCLDSDVKLTCLVDEMPAFMFGVNRMTLLGNKGAVWMLGTEDMYKIKYGKLELKLMREYARQLAEPYDVIENYVHVENEISIKWLRFMGFKFDEPQPYGFSKAPFMRFEMRNSHV